jgi:predicted acetyltransferase
MELRTPTVDLLPSYEEALRRRWSPNTMRPGAADDELEWVERDPEGFVASLTDRDGAGPPVVQPDGSVATRIPGFRLWMWDGEVVGSIGLRWVPGTHDLPAYVSGHVGYAVVPWRQRRGYATSALRQLLPHAVAEGLSYVELTTDVDNVASQRVILANGGVETERFTFPDSHGGGQGIRYRITLDPNRPGDDVVPH